MSLKLIGADKLQRSSFNDWKQIRLRRGFEKFYHPVILIYSNLLFLNFYKG
ncbi:MAG: hypothetical protein ACD_37C00102G0001, partial [uncultured bacterium]